MVNSQKNNRISLSLVTTLVALITTVGCGKQKTKNDMNFDELKNHAGSLLKKQKYEASSEILEEIITKNPERQDLHKFKLVLADVYFKTENYQSAYEMYQNYWLQYPSHSKAEYAKYQAILSKYYQTLKIDCDQTTTQETIDVCKEYQSNILYRKYLEDVTAIQKTCQHKLINKEIYVFNFYLGQHELQAAKSRLNYLKAQFLDKDPSLEARVCFLECKLAKVMKDEKTIQEKRAYLAQCYPDSPFTRMTEDLFKSQQFEFH